MKIENMSIKKRLLLGFGGMFLLISLLLGMTILTGISQQNRFQELIDHDMAADQSALSCRNQINRSARNLREMLLIQDTKGRANMYDRYLETKQNAMNDLQHLQELDPLGDGSIDNYAATVKAWAAEADRVAEAVQRGDIKAAARLIDSSCRPALEAMGAASKVVDANLDQQVDREQARITTSRRIINITDVVLGIVLILLSLKFALEIIHSICAPTEEARNTLIALSQGNFDVHTEYDGADEIGDMCRALRLYRENLSHVISDQRRLLHEMANGNFDVQTDCAELYVGGLAPLLESTNLINAQLTDLISQINMGAEQVATGANQVADGAQALAQGATEQASAVEELSATINEIADAARNNAEISAQALEGTKTANQLVNESAENMGHMVSAMTEIHNSSEEIGKIIATIENIAFQTNILALNAAVEAARAGAAGKGFAVVADEVRNLAAKSDQAAKATKELISSSIESVRKGDTIVKEVAVSLDKTMEAAGKVNGEIERIATAVTEEAESITQVTEGIEQISAVVQNNSATSEESAAASQELSGQAQMIREMLGKFHLRRMVPVERSTPQTQPREYRMDEAPAAKPTVSHVSQAKPADNVADEDSSAFSKY